MAQLRLRAASQAVRDVGRAYGLISRRRLREANRDGDAVERRLATAAPRLLERHRSRPRLLGERLAGVASGRLREVEATLGGIARVCSELAPERVLERGYSITRDRTDKIVRDPRRLEPGEQIVTTLARGTLKSRVEEI